MAKATTYELFTVPARENDAAEGRQYSHVRADELTNEELGRLSPNDRDRADVALFLMDAA